MDKLQTPNSWGLTQQQAQKALQKYGPNCLQEGKKTSLLKLFISQFSNGINRSNSCFLLPWRNRRFCHDFVDFTA